VNSDAGVVNKMREISADVAESMARALLRMCDTAGDRGRMVQQGAMRLLLGLCRHTAEKAHMAAALALARIAITTNPALVDAGQ
jgi:hypothetical protein